MKTFYILHYSDDEHGESVVITEETPTPEVIADNRPPSMKFYKYILCETVDPNFNSLPLDSEMRKR